MRIGIDIDDTLFDFVGAWIAEYNKNHDDNVVLEDITDWEFSGVEFKCERKEFYNYLHNAYLQLRAEAFPSAIESLGRLGEMGHLPCFITATRRSVAPTKINKLLMELGPDLDYELHFTREKWHVACDAYMDDNPRDIEKYMAHRAPEFPLVMLYDRPWNRHVTPAISAETFITEAIARANRGWRLPDKNHLTQWPVRVKNWHEAILCIGWYDVIGKELDSLEQFQLSLINSISYTEEELHAMRKVLEWQPNTEERFHQEIWMDFPAPEDVPDPKRGHSTNLFYIADEGPECHGCIHEYECSLTPIACGGPYDRCDH